MHREQAVDGGIGERQHGLLDHHHVALAVRGPGQRTLARRHQRAEPGGLAAEYADVGNREAQAHQLGALDAAPAGADAARQQATYHAAERAVVEVAQADDVGVHELCRCPAAPARISHVPGRGG